MIKYIQVWFRVLWVKIFHPRQDTSVIPEGPYCYSVDHEKNKLQPIDGYWIKPCPYFHKFKSGKTACTYEGFLGFDVAHHDQCKICNENDD